MPSRSLKIYIHFIKYVPIIKSTLVSYVLYALGHYIFMNKVLKKHKIKEKYYNDKAIIGISILFIIATIIIIPLYNYLALRYLLIIILFISILFNREKIVKYLKN